MGGWEEERTGGARGLWFVRTWWRGSAFGVVDCCLNASKMGLYNFILMPSLLGLEGIFLLILIYSLQIYAPLFGKSSAYVQTRRFDRVHSKLA